MDIVELNTNASLHRVNAVAILAMDKKGGIGIGDSLPKFPKIDLAWFKHNTLHKICIVGSNTFATLPPLYDRKFIVLSRNPEECIATKINGPNKERVIGVRKDLHQAIITAKRMAFDIGQTEVMVVGGAEIYNQCFIDKLVDDVLVTQVWTDEGCDKFIEVDALKLNYKQQLLHSGTIDDKPVRFYRLRMI